jgi:[acyl-carrier-protein] S-malonyltransferase
MEPAAFVFPGQGSQYAGMGADLAREPRYRRLIAEANRLSGLDVTRALHAVPPDGRLALPSTVTTQLSVFALSVCLGRMLLDGGVWPRVVAGHSLGEFSALVVGGWLDVDAALALVAERAAAMERCCIDHDGAMIAVVGLDEARVADAVSGTGAVLANVNSAKQVVVSGSRQALTQAAEGARAAGASMVVELPVAGAFHSPHVAAAEVQLADSIRRLPLRRGTIDLVSSMTGRLVDDLDVYRRHLAGQMTAQVRWLDVMRQIAALNPAACAADDIVEVGPGAVLRGLFRQFDRRRRVVSCGLLDDCDALIAAAPVRVSPVSG